MKSHSTQYPITVMSRVLNVSSSGYYKWLQHKPSLRQQRQVQQETAVKAAHLKTRETYGYQRLHAELLAEKHVMSAYKVRTIRQKLGLRCKQVKKFKATTNSTHDLPVADNLLNQTFTAHRPNEAWVSDITYIPTDEGWLYLAGIKDIYTCEIVGYALGERMTKGLCMAALSLALAHRKPPAGLILHSDRGSQYCAYDYQKQLTKAGLVPSMSRKGNCYDNAPMESFWGSLKNELVHHQRYTTRKKAADEITEYIEMFYNRSRRHTRLGNVAPALFRQQFEQSQVQSF
jgi:transposase InsO family protein